MVHGPLFERACSDARGRLLDAGSADHGTHATATAADAAARTNRGSAADDGACLVQFQLKRRSAIIILIGAAHRSSNHGTNGRSDGRTYGSAAYRGARRWS